MIASFEDFVTWMYVLVDEYWHQLPPDHRPGPAPACSDAELVTMLLAGECRGWHTETELIANWGWYRDLFPIIPSRSRFNRRRRALAMSINALRQAMLATLDLAADRQCIIDSIPIPVIHFHLVPGSRAVPDWQAHGATFGWVPSKKQRFFGYKLTLLIAGNGLVLDFVLAPANAMDLEVGVELLAEHAALDVVGDKGYISQPVATELANDRAITLLTTPRRNQRVQLPAALCRLQRAFRQRIETVNEQLADQLGIESNHAHTFWGLCARLYTKLTAHTACIAINRLLGKEDVLQIKALAFPY